MSCHGYMGNGESNALLRIEKKGKKKRKKRSYSLDGEQNNIYETRKDKKGMKGRK